MDKPNAGKPGFGPYPTFHDKVLSRRLFHEFVIHNHLKIEEECGYTNLPPMQRLFTRFIKIISLGRLASSHVNLMYILQKEEDFASIYAHPNPDLVEAA